MNDDMIRKAKAAIKKYGSVSEAARQLGIPRKTLADRAQGVITEPKQRKTRREDDVRDRVLVAQRALRAALPKVSKAGQRIAVIPDTQVKPGVPTDHLRWLGQYLARKQPDTIVCIGDFADMASLSSYDKGTRKFEGRRYRLDLESVERAMDLFMNEINKAPNYGPNLVLTLGNHEQRIERATIEDPKLEGLLKLSDLKYESWGWSVVPFLQPIIIDGVAFCHYFPSGIMGRPVTTARQLLTKLHKSAFAGHQQGREIAYGVSADMRNLTAIICGSFYQHEEDYLSPFSNGTHWRGMYMLHDVRNGEFDEMPVSLEYLRRKFA